MPKWIKIAWEWVGHLTTAQAIIQTSFVRVVLLPSMIAFITGSTGALGGLPLMWIIMASTVAFAAVMSSLLRGSEYLERKNPENKLVHLGTHFQVDLPTINIPAHLLGNRIQRRAIKAQNLPVPQLSSTQVMAGVRRTIDKGQICIEVQNKASFPISTIIVSAETEIENKRPPRSQFPKPPIILRPGQTVRISDDGIEMGGVECQRMAGKMEFKIKYGLPGKENFELHLKANVDIQMENFGFVSTVITAWLL